jgi:hypothetical protein
MLAEAVVVDTNLVMLALEQMAEVTVSQLRLEQKVMEMPTQVAEAVVLRHKVVLMMAEMVALA